MESPIEIPNPLLGMKVMCITNTSYASTKNGKALRKRFREWYDLQLKESSRYVMARAGIIYATQLVDGLIFDNAGITVRWVPENFARLRFGDPEIGGVLWGRFMSDVHNSDSIGWIYAMNDDTAPTLQAIMYQTAADWFKYCKENERCRTC